MGMIDDWLKGKIKGQIDELIKSDPITIDGTATVDNGSDVTGDSLPDKPEAEKYSKKDIGKVHIGDDPYFENVTHHVMYKQKLSRISNKTLKDVSIRDWTVSAIMQCRADTLLRFARPSRKRLDMGYRVVKRDILSEWTDEDKAQVTSIEDFLYNCGRIEHTPPNDKMLFGEFLKLTVRDALTFGYITIEKVKTRKGGLHRFRPIPAESMYLINKKLSKEFIEKEINAARTIRRLTTSNNDPRNEEEINQQDIEYYKYVQMSYDNRTLAAFGDEDMIFKLFNPQNFADSMGYSYSPLEMAILNITHHLNVENYNANFFTHGYAARGLLHLKGTVTQSQLAAFRRQFYNQINGAQHSWRTPVVAGLEEVNWIPMSGTAKEMEYINFNNHILRAICAQFQIDPIEIGLDYLNSSGGRAAPMQQSNNEYKINYSRERGLYPILMFFEDMINCDIIPAIDPELAKKYKFIFTGYTDESPQTDIAQAQAEMTVHSTMNDLLTRAEKSKFDEPAANLPLNAAFWGLVEKNYTRGEIREKFFGDKGASQKKELQYIPADPAFLAWQQLLITIDRTKKQDKMMQEQMQAQQEQAEAEKKQQELENTHAQGKHEREEQAHGAEMEAIQAQQAHGAVKQGNSLTDNAILFGATRKPINIEGTPVANPIKKGE